MKDFNPELNEKTNAIVSDDELEAVAGGVVVQQISTGAAIRVKCATCGTIFLRGYQDKCPVCSKKVSSNSIGMNQEKNLIHKSVSTQQIGRAHV